MGSSPVLVPAAACAPAAGEGAVIVGDAFRHLVQDRADGHRRCAAAAVKAAASCPSPAAVSRRSGCFVSLTALAV